MKKFVIVFLLSVLCGFVLFDRCDIKGERILNIVNPRTWVKLWTVTGYDNSGGRNWSYWSKEDALVQAGNIKERYPLVRITFEPSGEDWTVKDEWDEYMKKRGQIIWLDAAKSGVSGWR